MTAAERIAQIKDELNDLLESNGVYQADQDFVTEAAQRIAALNGGVKERRAYMVPGGPLPLYLSGTAQHPAPSEADAQREIAAPTVEYTPGEGMDVIWQPRPGLKLNILFNDDGTWTYYARDGNIYTALEGGRTPHIPSSDVVRPISASTGAALAYHRDGGFLDYLTEDVTCFYRQITPAFHIALSMKDGKAVGFRLYCAADEMTAIARSITAAQDKG